MPLFLNSFVFHGKSVAIPHLHNPPSQAVSIYLTLKMMI